MYCTHELRSTKEMVGDINRLPTNSRADGGGGNIIGDSYLSAGGGGKWHAQEAEWKEWNGDVG